MSLPNAHHSSLHTTSELGLWLALNCEKRRTYTAFTIKTQLLMCASCDARKASCAYESKPKGETIFAYNLAPKSPFPL